MEKFCLKWNDFQTNVSKSFSTLRKEKEFYDVTLVTDDSHFLMAHKVVLSASSDFLKSLLRKLDLAKPLIYLSGIGSKELGQIMEYIYEGKVKLFRDDIDTFLEVAKKLKIDGLDGNEEKRKDLIPNNFKKEEYDVNEHKRYHMTTGL